MIKNEENTEKRVLIYCRQSRDDYLKNYDRIETQRDLLVDFCKANKYTIVGIVMHDDMTGTDFSRFDEVKERILRGEIDALVMKDSSRLGRNILESLKFVEFLDQHKVELIFEGKEYNEDFFPLEAWFNERRAKDDSIKIRRNLRHKIEKGELLIRQHYGYIKVGNKLVVDKEVAWVVELIFDLYLEGYGYRAIAGILNKMNPKPPTPSERAASLALNHSNITVVSAWSLQHIYRILRNETYIGTLVIGVSEKVSYKSKKVRRLPKEEWIKKENAHEAIVSKDKFYAVQKMITSKAIYAPKGAKSSLFSGLMFCGRCNSPMYLLRRNDKPNAYVCGVYHREGRLKSHENGLTYGCTSHRQREDELLNYFARYFEQVFSNSEKRKELLNDIIKNTSIKESHEEKIKYLSQKIKKNKEKISQIYEDKLNNLIPDFLFVDKTKSLQAEIEESEALINQIKESMNNIKERTDSIVELNNAIDEIIQNGLSKSALKKIIKKIVVFDKGEIDVSKKKEYNITSEEYEHILENGGLVVVYNYMQ